MKRGKNSKELFRSQSNELSFALFLPLVLFWGRLDVGQGTLEITDLGDAVSSPPPLISRSRVWWKQALDLEAEPCTPTVCLAVCL